MKQTFKWNSALFILTFLLIACNTDKSKSMKEPISEPKQSFREYTEVEALKIADSIVALMSLDEKLSLIKGDKSFFIKGFEKYGLPEIYMSDATQGVHIRKTGFKNDDLSNYALPKSTAFPNALCLTATWSPNIAFEYAKSIGEECKAAGIGILLGPGMNIYRNSQNGRNFEYMGEDPYLASSIVEEYVKGVQSTGVMATLKHFIGNETDYNRRASNSIIDERTLHEIYMPAFKAGIDAGAMAVMTSYNQINGEWAGQSDYVIDYLLRDQLGFKNLVMTDWWSVNDSKKLVASGQDIEMPGGESMVHLKSYVESGDVSMEDIDRMCRSIVKTIVKFGFLDRPIKNAEYLENFDQHVEVALNTAREGIILLRNENNLLPIKEPKDKKILLTGFYVDHNIYGGGSGEVEGYDIVTILDALQKEFPNLEYKKDPTEDDIKNADVVLLSVGTFDYEGTDRHFSLPDFQENLVKRISNLNSNTAVIVNSGAGINMMDWNHVSSIVYNWYPGQIGNTALAEILAGKTNPSGKLPMTIEKSFKDSPAYGYLPDGAKFMSDIEGHYDINNPEFNRWQLDMSIEDAPNNLYDVIYKEGVLVGYRWYETKDIEPLFPFGFGLSYSSFEISNTVLSSNVIKFNESVKVSLTLKNTGKMEGATVAQVYVEEKNPSIVRPVKELKAFKKVYLKSGEEQRIELELAPDAFAFWNPDTKSWTINNGMFLIHIGQSSKDIEHSLEVTIED